VLDRLRRGLRDTGTRTRLTAAIALISVAALGATFVAVYRGTGSSLRAQIDRDLAEDSSAVVQHVRRDEGARGTTAARNPQRYINAQPTFGPSSELIVVETKGARPATNEPELLGIGQETAESTRERNAEAGEPRLVRSAPDGYATIRLADVGQVRLLTTPLIEGHRQVGKVTVGQSLDSVANAQSGVARTFLVAGSLVLVAALVAGALVAGLTTKPLRRMAGVAGAVDAGDLSSRMTPEGPAEARRLAESFNRMLDRLEGAFSRQRAFVSDASHELRTPLTAIKGQIEVLARLPRISRGEVSGTAETVAREIERMERLVDDLLLLAQADEGLAHDPKPMEVAGLLDEALAGLPLTDRTLTVGEVPSGTVVADPDRIAQVIRNLVRNAIEHTSADGVIGVTAAVADGRLRIGVDDDGPGIPRRHRNRIFDRFFRAEGSRDRHSGGTGLGLAIARAIVEAHDGRIWADEGPRGGARITFELPGFRASPA
jgi:two-component system OmpR family sensor kinase